MGLALSGVWAGMEKGSILLKLVLFLLSLPVAWSGYSSSQYSFVENGLIYGCTRTGTGTGIGYYGNTAPILSTVYADCTTLSSSTNYGCIQTWRENVGWSGSCCTTSSSATRYAGGGQASYSFTGVVPASYVWCISPPSAPPSPAPTALPTALPSAPSAPPTALPSALPSALPTALPTAPTARPSTAAPTHSAQLGALRDLWTALGGTAQLGLVSWQWEAEYGSKGGNFTLMCTSWVGISCADGKRVTGISLPSSALKGTLPSTIGALSTLQVLNLANNYLRGTLPSGLSRLSALQQLNLANNRFSGPITWAAILPLSQLTFLGLDNNVFAPPAPKAAMTDALLTAGLPSLREVHIDAPQLLDSYNATFAQQQVVYDALQLPSSFLSTIARVTPAGFDPVEAVVSDPARTLANMRDVKIVRSDRASAVGVRVQTARIAQPSPPVEAVPTPSPSSLPTSEPSLLPTPAPSAVPSTRPTAAPSAAPTAVPAVLSLDAATYTSGTTWTDSVGNKAFTLYGAPTYSATVGGGSFLFQGGSSGQYAQSSSALPSMSQWSVEVWHYYSGTETLSSWYTSAIVTDIASSTSMNFALGNYYTSTPADIHTLGASFVGTASGADWITASPSQTLRVLTAGNWYHIVGTYDGADLKIYINGVLSASTATTKTPTAGGVGIGLMRRWNNADSSKTINWGGRLAIVRIYAGALSSISVLANYNKDSARFTSTPTSVLNLFSTSAFQITDNNVVGTVDLPSQYIISFDAQFSSFSGAWQNILHLNGNSDGSWSGEKSRLPTVESCNGIFCCSTCLHVSRSGTTYSDLMTSALSTGTWYSFTIAMDFVSGQMTLSVIPTGGSGDMCATCSAALLGITYTTFSSVKVWAATPTSSGVPAMTSASIRNLVIEAPSSSSDVICTSAPTALPTTARFGFASPTAQPTLPFFSYSTSFTILASNFVGSIELLPAKYSVSFDLKPTSTTQANWAGIFRLTTTTANCCNNGDRLPAAFFGLNPLKMFISLINGGADKVIEHSTQVPVNKWSTVTITVDSFNALMAVSMVDTATSAALIAYNPSQAICTATSDTCTTSSVRYIPTPTQQTWSNVKVYLADALSTAATASIRNFAVTDLNPSGLVLSLDAATYSGSGNTWTDSVGNKAFTLYGAPTYSATVGGGSFSFTGGRNAQYADSSVALPLMTTWTVEVWHYYTGGTDSSTDSAIVTDLGTNGTNFVLKRSSSDVNTIAAYYCSGKCDGAGNNGPSNGAPSSGYTLTANQWYHIVGTLDASKTLSLYINGASVGSVTNTMAVATSGDGIGLMRRWDSSNEKWGGGLAIVKIYNRDLSAADISSNFASSRSRFNVSSPGAYFGPSPTAQPTSLAEYSTAFTLARNGFVGNIALLPAKYSVSFDLKPTATPSTWAGIFRLTTTTIDCCTAGSYTQGSYIPGGWFNAGLTMYAGITSVTSTTDVNIKTSTAYQLNVWTRMTITVDFANALMTMTMADPDDGGSLLAYDPTQTPCAVTTVSCTTSSRKIPTPAQQTWSNVKVYLSDNFYAPAAASMRNFAVTKLDQTPSPTAMPTLPAFDSPTAFTLSRGNFVGTIALLPAKYSVSFDLNPSSAVAGWTNIFRLTTTTTDCCSNGDRRLGVWFFDGLNAYVSLTSPSSFNAIINTPTAFPANVRTRMTITVDSFNTLMTVTMANPDTGASLLAYDPTQTPCDATIVECTTSSRKIPTPAQQTWSNVKVYLSDNFYAPAAASMRNFAVTNLGSSLTRVNSGAWPEIGQNGWFADNAGGASGGINVALSATNSGTQNVVISAIMYYKTVAGNAQMTTARVGGVYSSDGTLLGSTVTFTGETGSGWQVQALSTPVTIAPGGSFRVVVNMMSYVSSSFPGTSEGIFTNLCSYYAYGATIAFPTNQQCGWNRMIDVVYSLAPLRVNSGSWPELNQPGWTVDGDNAGGFANQNINAALSATNSASTSIIITAIMYYKTVAGNAQMTTARVGGVYSSDGTLLGSTVTFTGETGSGWQVQALSTPVTIDSGGSFRVVVNMKSYVSSTFPSTTEGIFTNLCSYYSASNTIAFPTTAQCYYNRMIDVVYTMV